MGHHTLYTDYSTTFIFPLDRGNSAGPTHHSVNVQTYQHRCQVDDRRVRAQAPIGEGGYQRWKRWLVVYHVGTLFGLGGCHGAVKHVGDDEGGQAVQERKNAEEKYESLGSTVTTP